MIEDTRFGREHELLRLWTTQLYAEFSALCYRYRLSLKKPVMRIVELDSRWGSWDPNTRTITISRNLIERYSWTAVLDVLKHEIAHMIVNEEFNIDDHNHGDAFRLACKKIGANHGASATDADLSSKIPGMDSRDLPEADRKLLDRVEKLLALAQSSNEHEAFLAMKRVRELYAKYNLERLRQNQHDAEFATIIINHRKRQIPQHQSAIASILISYFFVEVVFSEFFDAEACVKDRTMEIMGTRQNVAMAEYVYNFLNQKINMLWNDYKKTLTYSQGARRSYFLGVINGFRKKLEEDSHFRSDSGQNWPIAYAADHSIKALIAVADRQLKDYVSSQFPRLSTMKYSSAIRDYSSYSEGQKEGRKITIHKPIERKHTGELRFLN